MNKKLAIFLEVAQHLNKHSIYPILYGSLGVSRYIKVKDIGDIDIIVPDKWLEDNLKKFKDIMKKIGYTQDDQFPNEFREGKVCIGFEPLHRLRNDMSINSTRIKKTILSGVTFGELPLKQYRVIYKKTIKFWEKRISKMKDKVDKLNEAIEGK